MFRNYLILFHWKYFKLRFKRFWPKNRMPKNKGKGGKNRRRGKNENDDIKRELVQCEPGQVMSRISLCFRNFNSGL